MAALRILVHRANLLHKCSVLDLELVVRFPFSVYTYERLESLSSHNCIFSERLCPHFRHENVDGI